MKNALSGLTRNLYSTLDSWKCSLYPYTRTQWQLRLVRVCCRIRGWWMSSWRGSVVQLPVLTKYSLCSLSLLTRYPVLSLGPSSVWSWSQMNSIWCFQGADSVLFKNIHSTVLLKEQCFPVGSLPVRLPPPLLSMSRVLSLWEADELFHCSVSSRSQRCDTTQCSKWKRIQSVAQHAWDQKKKALLKDEINI